jgi:uroporphyrin-III C-methyltransferase
MSAPGSIVVRLKGGDPFVFGRGGEEVEAVRAAGLAVEVVPGVSAALGCAAEAMLPLTHRDWSSAVSFVAGQCKGLSEQDWSGLAGKGRTLVIYMGVANGSCDRRQIDGRWTRPRSAGRGIGARHACPDRARCAPCSPIWGTDDRASGS